MKKQTKTKIQTTVFIGIGLILLFFVYKNFDFSFFIKELSSLDYFWFILVLILALASHILRALRWQMLIDTDGDKTRFLNILMAVFNGYFANMVFPRLGEITRCTIVSKYENIPFSKLIGTMITERIIDLLTFILVIILCILTQFNQIEMFLKEKGHLFQDKFQTFAYIHLLIILLLLAIASIIIFQITRERFSRFKFFRKISNFLRNIYLGAVSILKIKHLALFIFHSITIWLIYFLMLYFSFFAFQGFQSIDIGKVLILFIAGGLGMLIPAPNGIGAYHFMIIETLVIFGIHYDKAASFALISHGLQSLCLILFGIISFIFIPIINKNR